MGEANDNAALVERVFSAFSAGDLDAAYPYYAENLQYHLLNFSPRHTRLYEGREAFFDMRRMIRNVTKDTWSFDIFSVTEAGPELVIVHAASHADYDGRHGGGDWVAVVRVIDGVIVQITDTADTRLDQFWRPPARAAG